MIGGVSDTLMCWLFVLAGRSGNYFLEIAGLHLAALSSAHTLEAKLKLSAINVDACNNIKLELFMTNGMLLVHF